MLWEGRERHKGVATWMQVRKELDASKRGPGAKQRAPGGQGTSRGSRSARGRALGTGPEGTGQSGGGWRGERSWPGIGQRQQHLPGHAGRRADPRRGPRLRRRRAPAAGAPAKPHPPPGRPPRSHRLLNFSPTVNTPGHCQRLRSARAPARPSGSGVQFPAR